MLQLEARKFSNQFLPQVSVDASACIGPQEKGVVELQRHKELRDAFGDLSAMVWNQVKLEPLLNVRDWKTMHSSSAFIADLEVSEV